VFKKGRTETFMKLSKEPVYAPLSGKTKAFNKRVICEAGSENTYL
jgi:hypothetical protein